MLRHGERIVAVKNHFGTEYVIETATRKKVQSVQVIVSTGRRRTELDKALAEEYLIYVKRTIYKKYEHKTRYARMELPTHYLNVTTTGKSPKSRRIIANIFRLMYSFLYLMGYNTIENLSYDQALSLVDFLKNSSRYVASDENLVRDDNSVALYLSHIRSYVKWLGHDHRHPLLRTNLVIYNDAYGNRQVAEQNEVSVRHCPVDSVRYHIKPDEYLRIREARCLQSEHYRLLVKCIVDLMFLHGLRIGEVFALTLEDIYTDSDGTICIGIRNRFTKDRFRLAKGCINVATPSNYTDSEYQRKDSGYQVIYLEREATRTLLDYISSTHEFLPPRRRADKNAYRRRKKAYTETTVADTVADYISSDYTRKRMKLAPLKQRSIDGKNHYLFLNSKFNPLSGTHWNRILREVMISEHVGVDYDRKVVGLNHRFRHGFAIFLIHVLKLDQFEVMKLMRHHSLASLEPYLKLTAEDVRDLRTEHTKSLFDIIKKCFDSNR